MPSGYSQRAGLCKVGISAWGRLPMRVARPERKAEQKDGDNIRPLKQREKYKRGRELAGEWGGRRGQRARSYAVQVYYNSTASTAPQQNPKTPQLPK